MSEMILRINGLYKSFHGRKVIDNLSLEIGKGDVYGFLGPHGSGKTTTIKMILGLIFPDRGEIQLFGGALNRINIARVGAVIETPRFYEDFSGMDNLRLLARLYQAVPEVRIHEVLKIAGLSDSAKDKVRRYSLGMKQRLGIAAALLNAPDFLILDEPTNGLDPQGMKEIREIILQLALERDITIFITSHLLYEVEIVCSKVAVLHQGKKMAEGEVAQLLQGDLETLGLVLEDREGAASHLKNIAFVKGLKRADRGLEITLDKGFSSEVIKVLVQNNIVLHYAYPCNRSLESLFMDLTKGEGCGA